MWSSFDILYISQLIFVSISQSSKHSCCWYKINRCVFLCCFIMYSICVIHANIFFPSFFFFLIVDFLMQIQNHACINYDKIKLTSKIYSKTSNHAVLESVVLEQLSFCCSVVNVKRIGENWDYKECTWLYGTGNVYFMLLFIYMYFVVVCFFFCSLHMYIIALK